MPFFYNIFISFYFFAIRIASLFNKKAKLWVAGRKGIFAEIEKKIDKNAKIAWFHSASLGEFEQGRPVIEKFKAKFPDYKILLTFFSPSGYEIRKNYEGADYIFYLPADTRIKAKRFIELTKPKIVFFIKYEFWYNYLKRLQKRNIPTIIFSSNFRQDQLFFSWYGKWFRKILGNFSHIFVQTSPSLELLNKYNINNASVAGDTRFDRVVEIAQLSKSIEEIDKFKSGKKILIGGSTWERDEELLIQYFNTTDKDFKLIIAPHEIDQKHIEKIKSALHRKYLLLSEATTENVQNIDCIIVDSIGKLSSIYKYADIAYIGGGFGKGIHNILEASVFGMPIIFGPNFEKFVEANDMVELGAASTITNYGELRKLIDSFIDNKDLLDEVSAKSKYYVGNNSGAVDIIMREVNKIIAAQ